VPLQCPLFSLTQTDKELETLTTDLSEKLIARAGATPGLLPGYLDLFFVARALERIRDHGTNIEENPF